MRLTSIMLIKYANLRCSCCRRPLSLCKLPPKNFFGGKTRTMQWVSNFAIYINFRFVLELKTCSRKFRLTYPLTLIALIQLADGMISSTMAAITGKKIRSISSAQAVPMKTIEYGLVALWKAKESSVRCIKGNILTTHQQLSMFHFCFSDYCSANKNQQALKQCSLVDPTWTGNSYNFFPWRLVMSSQVDCVDAQFVRTALPASFQV